MLETELSLVYSIQIIMKVMQENVGQNAGQKRISLIAKHECITQQYDTTDVADKIEYS